MEITVSRTRDGLPVAARYTACVDHVDAVRARVAPPIYSCLRRDDRHEGKGRRATLRPARVVVGPCEVAGTCAECGAHVAAAERRKPVTYLDML